MLMHCRPSETHETQIHVRLFKYYYLDNTINILLHLAIHQKQVQPRYSISEQVHVHVHCIIARLLERL